MANAVVSAAATGERLRARFTVTYDYTVRFTVDALAPDNLTLAEVIGAEGVASVLPVLDTGLLAAHPALPERLVAYGAQHADRIDMVTEPVRLPGGEQAKNDAGHVDAVHAAIARSRLDRHSYVLAIGGGAVLDAAGFATATAHRGVRLIRLPTTVLAQNDSGVGVKNGVNAHGAKNFVGTFAPPHAVVNDSGFLRTLSDRDWRAGISEAVKVAALKDATFFGELESAAERLAGRDDAVMCRVIRRCAELHLRHIADGGDPFETGASRPLDFGHWSAHKIEQLSRFRLRHGEAVAVGIAIDSTYAYRIGLLPAADWRRILALLARLGLRFDVVELADHRLLDGLGEFREHLGGPLTITTLAALGEGVDLHEIDEPVMSASIADVRRWGRRAV